MGCKSCGKRKRSLNDQDRAFQEWQSSAYAHYEEERRKRIEQEAAKLICRYCGRKKLEEQATCKWCGGDN